MRTGRNFVKFRIPPDELGLVRGQQIARMRGRHDGRIDFVGRDGANDGIECLHWPHRNTVHVDLLDPCDLLQLIVRDRAQCIDRDCLAGDILEFLQTFAEPDVGHDELGALVSTRPQA